MIQKEEGKNKVIFTASPFIETLKSLKGSKNKNVKGGNRTNDALDNVCLLIPGNKLVEEDVKEGSKKNDEAGEPKKMFKLSINLTL